MEDKKDAEQRKGESRGLRRLLDAIDEDDRLIALTVGLIILMFLSAALFIL